MGLWIPPHLTPGALVSGGGGGWPTLTVTSGLIGRWRANAGVTESGGNVTAVADQSGNGNDLANDGTVPLNLTGFNGKPAFDFVAANDAALICDPFGFGTPVSFTIVVIGQMDTGTVNFGGAVVYGDGANNDYNTTGYGAFITRDSGNNGLQSAADGLGSTPTAAVSLATPFVAVYRNDQAGGNDASFWIDGVEGTPVSHNGNAMITGGVLVIGNRYLGSVGGAAWDGAIGEVLVYDAALSDANIATIQTYAEDANGWAL